MSYNGNNIFAKILKGEIPCNKVYEDDYVLSFHDINPQKKNSRLRCESRLFVFVCDHMCAHAVSATLSSAPAPPSCYAPHSSLEQVQLPHQRVHPLRVLAVQRVLARNAQHAQRGLA